MKKSVKILIVVLCLIILGLATFIIVDKVINKHSDVNTIIIENSNEISNNSSNITDETKTFNNNENNNTTNTNVVNKSGNENNTEDGTNEKDRNNKSVASAEDIRVVADYDYVSSTSGYMKVIAYDLNSNVVWTYKTETDENFYSIYKLDWFHTDRAYVLLGNRIIVLNALNGKVLNTCEFSKNYVDILATSVNTEKGYYYVIVRNYYETDGKDTVYKIDNNGSIAGKSDIVGNYGTNTIYEIFAQGVSIDTMNIDSSEKILTCMLYIDEVGYEKKEFDIDFK